MKPSDLRCSVLLGMQRALLGCIGPAVRKIMCQWNEREVLARVIFEGEISEVDADAISEAETEMMADFPNHTVSFKLQRCDRPANITQRNDEHTVFSRREL
jgi:hypothetical protein